MIFLHVFNQLIKYKKSQKVIIMNLLQLKDITVIGTPPGGYAFFNKRAVQEFLSWICIPEEVKMVSIDYTLGTNLLGVSFTLEKQRPVDVRYTIIFSVDDAKLANYALQYNLIHNFTVNSTIVSIQRLLGKGFLTITEISDSLSNTFTLSTFTDFVTLIIEPMALIRDTLSN